MKSSEIGSSAAYAVPSSHSGYLLSTHDATPKVVVAPPTRAVIGPPESPLHACASPRPPSRTAKLLRRNRFLG